jgi:hypothetical protein
MTLSAVYVSLLMPATESCEGEESCIVPGKFEVSPAEGWPLKEPGAAGWTCEVRLLEEAKDMGC